MPVEQLSWVTTDTGLGWNRHEGTSTNFGPYVIEKEETRSFSVWWGGVYIGEANYWTLARRVAQEHCNRLSRTKQKED